MAHPAVPEASLNVPSTAFSPASPGGSLQTGLLWNHPRALTMNYREQQVFRGEDHLGSGRKWISERSLSRVPASAVHSLPEGMHGGV